MAEKKKIVRCARCGKPVETLRAWVGKDVFCSEECVVLSNGERRVPKGRTNGGTDGPKTRQGVRYLGWFFLILPITKN